MSIVVLGISPFYAVVGRLSIDNQVVYMAAPGKYKEWLEPKALLLLKSWSREGLKLDQLAKRMGISKDTLCVWRKQYPEIKQAIDDGSQYSDAMAQESLQHRIQGFTVQERTIIKRRNSETGQMEVVQDRLQDKYIPPDTTALIFWLKNRKPRMWRDKQEVQTTVQTVKDDGFTQALNAAGREVMADGTDTPTNLDG